MMLPLHSGKPQAASASLVQSASSSIRSLVVLPSTNRMPLSWSVAIVCSPRPSLPNDSQQKLLRIEVEALRADRQQAHGQLVVEVTDEARELRCRHALRDQVMRQTAHVGRGDTSASTSSARRIATASWRTVSRCSANRSRSETTPATRCTPPSLLHDRECGGSSAPPSAASRQPPSRPASSVSTFERHHLAHRASTTAPRAG